MHYRESSKYEQILYSIDKKKRDFYEFSGSPKPSEVKHSELSGNLESLKPVKHKKASKKQRYETEEGPINFRQVAEQEEQKIL